MQVTVLGKSPSWQDADGACSGYLVQEDGTAVLLDCGSGVFAKLRRFCAYTSIDAVVLSHLHADHFLDVVPFSYALLYAPRQQAEPVGDWPGTSSPARPALHAPRGARATFRQVAGAWGTEDLVERAFDLNEYRASDTLEIGPLRLRFHAVPHYVPTHAIEVTSADGGGRFVYGADSAPTEELVRFADGADLLMVEATLPKPDESDTRGHMSATEAGEHAARAHARCVVLTHISDELDQDRARAEAERAFGGPLLIAREGAVYEV